MHTDSPTLELGPVPFQPPSPFRRGFRKIRNWCVGIILAWILAEIFGLPSLRMTYEYRGRYSSRRILSGTYWNIAGSERVEAGEHSAGCPLVLLIPFEKPLHHRMVDWWRSLFSSKSSGESREQPARKTPRPFQQSRDGRRGEENLHPQTRARPYAPRHSPTRSNTRRPTVGRQSR